MAARPPVTPPAIVPGCLDDCDTGVWLAPDIVVMEEVEEEGVVEVVEPVGSGRGIKFEVGRDDERDGLEGEPEEVSDERVVVASRPLTAQAQMGGEVAGCAPQAKPVHELDRESSSF
jgi:hypothetical protein